MTAIRLVSGTVLAAMWSVVVWTVLHRRQIRAVVERNDAMPRPTPRRNFFLLLGIVLTATTVLLLYLMK
jgi:hypothetical protein